jgi:hypothetical protein
MKNSKLNNTDLNRLIHKILTENTNTEFLVRFRKIIGRFIEKLANIKHYKEIIEGFGWYSLEFDMETTEMKKSLKELFVDPIDDIRIDFFETLKPIIDRISGRGSEEFLTKINTHIYEAIKYFNSIVEHSKLLVETIIDEHLNADGLYVQYVLGTCDANLMLLRQVLNSLHFALITHTD